MVRRALLSSAGLMALSLHGASAQPLPPPVFSWTGAYVGVLAGGGFAHTRWTDVGNGLDGWSSNPPGAFHSVNPTGFVFGGFAGYNWQAMPGFVVGVEADLTYNTASGAAAFDTFGTRGFTAHANFAGSLRGRAGVAIDRLLLYVTGGLALGNPTARWFEPAGGPHWRYSGLRTGYVIGGGAEFMVSPNWTVRVEALHYNFGSANAAHVTPGSGDGYVMRVRSSQTQVRAGAAYRF